MFSIEIQTAGRIGMKFDTRVVLKGVKVLGGGFQPVTPPGNGCVLEKAIWWGLTPSTLTPGSQGAKRGAWWGSGASAVHFGGYFIKQKLLCTINLVKVGYL